MADPRETFLARINFKDTRIRAFAGYLFLCGGKHDAGEYNPLLSARHLIFHTLHAGSYSDLAPRLRVAEDIQDWFRDGMYSDLVTFEEHLAGLSSVILLIVESPGSIAELGAFAVTSAINKRLVVVVDEHYFEEESFIRLGPINRLEHETSRKVLVHDWHQVDILGRRSADYEKLIPDISQIIDEVRDLLRAQEGEQVFRQSEPGHSMILICELCDLFGALSHQEIAKYLHMADSSVTPSCINQYIFLLEKCGILKVKPKGQGRYYFAPNWRPHVTFSFLDSQRIDRDRLRVDVVDYYRQHLKSRAEVVRLIKRVQL